MRKLAILAVLVPSLLSAMANGTFSGTGTGKRGAVTVSVTFNNNKMTDIKVVSSKEDRTYAFDRLIPMMIKNNSTKVDTVSGATMSSKALITAVNQAKANAMAAANKK